MVAHIHHVPKLQIFQFELYEGEFPSTCQHDEMAHFSISCESKDFSFGIDSCEVISRFEETEVFL